MENFSLVADLIGVISAIAAVAAWVNTKRIQEQQKQEIERLNQRIKIRLIDRGSGNFIELPGEMRREELSRAEILGWIGMLPMVERIPRERFKLNFLNKPEFFTRMNDVKAGSGNMIFEIDCNEDDLNQFDVDKKVLSTHRS
jgi:hypothetical protein